MIVAIIPARGGSKRIPKKNIKNFAGKPIISYSIKVAREAKLFDRVIVSTDSEEIAGVARNFGAEVPFIRPPELSDDFTGIDAVALHALNWLMEHGDSVKYICCIFATAPFTRSEYIIKGFDRLRNAGATSAFSVTTFPYPIFRALNITDNGRLKMFWPENMTVRSQDFQTAYHDAGQFYWADVKKYLKEKQLFSKDPVPVILPRSMVQDIDTPEDWETAEKMYYALQMDNIK